MEGRKSLLSSSEDSRIGAGGLTGVVEQESGVSNTSSIRGVSVALASAGTEGAGPGNARTVSRDSTASSRH